MPSAIAEQFPNVVAWVREGWIEIGPTDWTRSFIRIMDEGGMVWQGEEEYESLEAAFAEAELVIEAWWNGMPWWDEP